MSDDRVNENADRVEEALQRNLTDEDRAAAAEAAKAKAEGAADAAKGAATSAADAASGAADAAKGAAAGAADAASGAVSGAAGSAKGMAGKIGGVAAAGAAGMAAGAKGLADTAKSAMTPDERRAAVGSTGDASVTTTTTTTTTTTGSTTSTTTGTAGRGAAAGSAGDGGGVAGAEKLIPEWGWSADNQIIAVGLLVLASIAGVAGWNTWRDGGDTDDVVAAVTETDGTTATTLLDEDGNVVTTVADSELDDADDDAAAATTTTVRVTTTELDLAPDVDAAVGAFGIAAATAGSETVLSGFVGTDAESERAETRAAAVDGITSVDNQLVVLEPQAQAAMDANSVRNGLASASGTVITATGIVDDEADRAATITALEGIEGVTGVDDQLTVIQDRAAAAVATQADGLDVTVADGVVTVTGTVVSEALEANALRAPMALPGVVEVIDQVEVDSPTANALNEIVDLDPVQFATNSAEILPASAATLDAAAEVILAAPEGTKVAVRGYTDVRGDDDANLALSQARTESVVAALVERGVDAAALSPVGLGETEQFGEGDDAEALAANRRVVFAQL